MKKSNYLTPTSILVLILINNYGPVSYTELTGLGLDFAKANTSHNLNELTSKNLVVCKWETDGAWMEENKRNKPRRIFKINTNGIDYLKGQHLI